MTRQRTGFTLIEMLIVVVVIGILGAIAIPRFAQAKGRTRAATIRSDLRNLATAQEEYLSEKGVYATNIADLDFTTTNGVVITIVDVVAGGWSATSTHPLSLPLTCTLYYGTAPQLPPATIEGVIHCE